MSENRYVTRKGKLIDIETFEIIDTKEIRKAKEKQIMDDFKEYANELIGIGEDVKLKIVKDKRGNEYHSIKIKEDYHFVKMFIVDIRDLLEGYDLSVYARSFILTCMGYLSFPTNSLIIDGQTPNNEMMKEKFKMGKTKLAEVYNELESCDVIKRKKINGQMVIYLNPFLHCRGYVDIDTFKMFKDSEFNPKR